MLVAIDPGFGGTGIAAFDDAGQLLAVKLLVPPGTDHDFAARLRDAAAAVPNVKGADVIVEFPQTYDGRSAKGDTDDLLKLAALIGAYVTAAGLSTSRISFVLPPEWKGNVPKDIHHKRIRGDLTQKELAVLDRYGQTIPASLMHNVMDAVGLGKWRFSNRNFQSTFGSQAQQSVRQKIRALRSGKSGRGRSRRP